MKKLIFFMALIIVPQLVYATDSILTCKFEKIPTFSAKNDVINYILDKDDNFKIVIAGLDTNNPVMKGNQGEVHLDIVRREADTIWLTEYPLLGGVNLITVFLDQKIAIFTKQYDMFGTPYGYMSMGKCQ